MAPRISGSEKKQQSANLLNETPAPQDNHQGATTPCR